MRQWSLDWFAVTHTIFLQKIKDELVLVEFESASGSVPFNRYTKEETSRTKIMTFEVLGKKMNILVNRSGGFGSKGDVINVDGDNDPDLSIGVDVDRTVRLDLGEAHFSQGRVKLLVPLPGRLLQPIQGLAQSTYLVGSSNVEPLWLLHVDLFIKVTIGESRGDVN